MPPSPEDVQEAVAELHQYLSDQKPPLMVADSVEMLLAFPTDFLAAQIHAWVAGQALSAPVADYLFHGAKKIAVMGDLDLVPHEALQPRLKELAPALLPYCPPDDRELLRVNVERLGLAARAVAAPSTLQPTPPPAQIPTAPPTIAATREAKRMSLLMTHLRPLAAPTAAPERRNEVLSHFLTTAALQAQSRQELDTSLAPLREVGVDPATEQVFRALAKSLAGWALSLGEGATPPPVSREQLEAMQRIVSLPEDPAEVGKRFREMVQAAVEQFNEGHLGRAVAMFDLAEKMITEQKVKPAFVEPLRTSAHERLLPEKLKAFAERTDYRPQLRRVLFFFKAFRPPALLAALDGEPQRDRRHQLLTLLEVHEQAARQAAWDLLKALVEPGAGADPFFLRNLVYLMRVIPRPPNASVEEEVEAVMKTSGRDSPPPLVKQVIAYLSATRHEKAERALVTYLKVFENMLLQPETAVYPAADVETLLDRTCAALARYGTPRAWKQLIDHGLKAEARLGSPFLRLGEAGRVDLSSSPDLVGRVIAAVRAEMPRGGVMAFVGRRSDDKALSLVQALAGTPLPEVQELLQEIASKQGEKPMGEAARKALASNANAGKAGAPPATLSGDLEQFGLPNLLHTLTQSVMTGVLSILDKDGRARATIVLEKSRFRGGQCGIVSGEMAVFELLEKPFPGTFAFVSRDPSGLPDLVPPQELLRILIEGLRRHDEYRRAAAVVPDGARLRPTGKKPSLPQGSDAALSKLIWGAVAAGKPIEACEAEMKTDAYTVRRLAAHWVEDGSMQIEGAPA